MTKIYLLTVKFQIGIQSLHTLIIRYKIKIWYAYCSYKTKYNDLYMCEAPPQGREMALTQGPIRGAEEH